MLLMVARVRRVRSLMATVPTILPDLLADKTPGRAERVMQALLQMKKLDIAALKRAAESA